MRTTSAVHTSLTRTTYLPGHARHARRDARYGRIKACQIPVGSTGRCSGQEETNDDVTSGYQDTAKQIGGLSAIALGTMVCSATSASAAPVIPGASVALLSNPTVVLGGLIGLVLAAGGAVIYSKPQGIGKGVIDRLMEEAEKAEEFWKKAVAEETLNEKLLKDGDAMIEAEWNAVAEARKALDEAEFRAKQMEEAAASAADKAAELRVKSAKAWIDNHKAKTKLEGTLKIKSQGEEKKKKK